MKIQRIFCLLSGGIDSTTALSQALIDFPDASVKAVTIDYGQRHLKEKEAAEAVVSYFACRHPLQFYHEVINAQGFMTGMLVDKGSDNEAIPDVSYNDLPEGISPTYVSFRNGLMLSILAARAQSWIMEKEKRDFTPEAILYCGVHADDGANWAYPDCTPEFIGGMSNAIFIGTYQKARLRAPLLYLTKADVVAMGIRNRAPLDHTWSCYKGEELHCGVCPTCRSRKEAFEILVEPDPTHDASDEKVLF